jgi:hypothetical protein
MNWLKLKLRDWVNSAQDVPSNLVGRGEKIALNSSRTAIRHSSDVNIDGHSGLNITVMPAIGGKVITFRHYDRRKDDTQYRHYVIPDDLDFERELGKMITLESMRQV